MGERSNRNPQKQAPSVLQEEISTVRAQLRALAEEDPAVLMPSSHNACLNGGAPQITKAQKLWRRLGELIALSR